MSSCVPCACRYPQRLERGTGNPEAGVTMSFELLYMDARNLIQVFYKSGHILNHRAISLALKYKLKYKTLL